MKTKIIALLVVAGAAFQAQAQASSNDAKADQTKAELSAKSVAQSVSWGASINTSETDEKMNWADGPNRCRFSQSFNDPDSYTLWTSPPSFQPAPDSINLSKAKVTPDPNGRYVLYTVEVDPKSGWGGYCYSDLRENAKYNLLGGKQELIVIAEGDDYIVVLRTALTCQKLGRQKPITHTITHRCDFSFEPK